MSTEDPFRAQHAGLVEVHSALSALLRQVAASDAAAPVESVLERADAARRFLLGHHHMEDAVLFPGLRRFGQLKTSDAAFLDARDSEHREIHLLCERLEADLAGPHPTRAAVLATAVGILEVLVPHFAREEAGLSPERLREMVSEPGLLEIGAELERARAGWPGARR